MEKRIRIIWVLSLVSAFLLIGVQGYWLYNQYEYGMDTYSEEIAELILDAGEEEYLMRKDSTKQGFHVIINTNAEFKNENGKEENKQQVMIKFSRDSIFTGENADGGKSGFERNNYQDFLVNRYQELMEEDTLAFRFKFNSRMSTDSITAAVNRTLTNYNNPFDPIRLDSIIRANMPHISFTRSLWVEPDSIDMISTWKRSGNLFRPAVDVYYAYSPFEQKGIVIRASFPPQPVFGRMAGQLLISFGLILLLIGCLVFQIKTILKQRKLNELRQSFVNTMIHELKRPVQTLKTFVSFLADKDMRADEVVTGQVIQDSMFELDNLSAYLNKLKDMVRADDEETHLRLVRFDLQELTERVIRLIHIPPGKEVEFSKYFDMESPQVEADPVHVANILSNLIENAVKYSGQKVEIEIKAKQKEHELWLSVSDNGIGIPLLEQDKVFAKFYRGSNLPDQNIPGLGLGLSYVKLISEAHQGYVSLQSRIGGGTTVTLFIPQ